MKKLQKGFTLIELMIVVAIIAILAAIAISQYQDYVIRSQVSEGSALSDGLKTAVGEFYNNNGRFSTLATPSNLSYGVAVDSSISGAYVSKTQISNTGQIIAYYGGPKANAKITTTDNLIFSPITHAGSIEWRCKKGTLPQKWVPSSCN